jgi:hypothetical protein
MYFWPGTFLVDLLAVGALYDHGGQLLWIHAAGFLICYFLAALLVGLPLDLASLRAGLFLILLLFAGCFSLLPFYHAF